MIQFSNDDLYAIKILANFETQIYKYNYSIDFKNQLWINGSPWEFKMESKQFCLSAQIPPKQMLFYWL